MNHLYFKIGGNRGEASLLYVFMVLMMVVVSAFTISIVTINSIKVSNVSESAAKAQTAVDSFLEKATFTFNWAEDADGVHDRCTRNSEPGKEGEAFVIDPWRDGSKVTVIVDDGVPGTDGGPGGCPSKEAVAKKDASLCVFVSAENNGILKKKMAGAGAGVCPIR